MKNDFTFVVIIPTLNAGSRFCETLESLKKQKNLNFKILCIDSGSSDGTRELIKKYDYSMVTIEKAMFDHGGTRQRAVDIFKNIDIVIFLTQDAILENEYTLSNLVKAFLKLEVGCAYGRQLPHMNADLFSAHARRFNYPSESSVKSMRDIKKLGIKTAFMSNSFAAYRKSALKEVGGFPRRTILGEDTYVAARMILKGWKVAYCADAKVYHSHNYSVIQEFKRYFDIGVFHAREPWIIESFGKAEGEGIRFIKSEILYLIKNKKQYLLPIFFIRTSFKYWGYFLGRREWIFPMQLKKILSMYSGYWKDKK